MAKYSHHSRLYRQKLLYHAKRIIKSIIAILSFWIPGIMKVLKSKTKKQQQYYSEVLEFEKAPRNLEEKNDDECILSQMVFTPDNHTNGLLEDMELIIQLVIDECTLKMKVGTKKGLNAATRVFDLVTPDTSDVDSHFWTVYAGISSSLYHCYSQMARVPEFACQSSSVLLNRVFEARNMFSLNHDQTTVQQMVQRLGYEYKQYEVETDDGYILQMNRIKNFSSWNVLYF